MRRLALPLAFALALLTACGGDGEGMGPDPEPDPVATTVTVTPGNDTLTFIGATVQLSAQVRDQNGNLMSGQTVSWSSSSVDVTTVSAAGAVTGVAAGSGTITATAGSASGSATILVTQVPAQLNKVHGDDQSAEAGTALSDSLVVELQDQGGTPIPQEALSWSVVSGGGSLLDAQNQTDASGRAFARWTLGTGADPQSVSVSWDGGAVEATFAATIRSGDALSIASISPSPIQEGQTATVTGTGLTGASVEVDGVSATILSSSDTELTFTVPITPCQPTRNGAVRVASGGSADTEAVTVLPSFLLDPLEFGQIFLTSGTDEGHCLHLRENDDAGVRYIVGVQSLADAASTLTPVGLGMATGVAAEPAPATGPWRAPGLVPSGVETQTLDVTPAPASARLPVASSRSRLHLPEPDPRWDRHRRVHLEQMRENQEIVQRLMADPSARAGSPAPSAAGPARVPPAVGEQVTVKIPESCTEFSEITTTVRAVGARGIWLEDNNNPAGGFQAADWQDFSSQYDGITGTRLDEFAGAMTDLDDNDRVVIVVSRAVNDRDNPPLGFVSGIDLVAASTCPASNEGEYFYAIAPDPDELTNLPRTLEEARSDYPSLIAHEVTHIIHFARQIYVVNSPTPPTTWELEGLATLMEQLVGHGFTGLGSGQNLGNAAYDDHFQWYGSWILDLAFYYGFVSPQDRAQGAPQECSWLDRPPNGPCANENRMPYGVPASLFRWIGDGVHTPATEAALTRALTDATTHGFDVLPLVANEDTQWVLAKWAIALAADDRFFASGQATFSSWDMDDVFGGFVETARLPLLERGYAFDEQVSVRAGSTAFYTLAGSHGQISFGASGLPPHMRLFVVRVQ